MIAHCIQVPVATPIQNLVPDRARYRRLPIWRGEFRSLRAAGITQLGSHLMDAGYRVARAEHSFDYQLLPIEGRIGYRVVEDGVERCGELEPGVCWHCPQHIAYEFWSDTGGRAVWWSLLPGTSPSRGCGESRLDDGEQCGRIPALMQWLFEDVEAVGPRRGRQLRAASELLTQAIIDASGGAERYGTQPFKPLWLEVFTRPELPWTLDELAQRCALSRYQLTRLMKKAYGCTPMAMVTRLRLQRVEDLLLEGDEALERIAEQVGYSSGFALSKAFKQHHGLSPQQFRELGG